jgi:hypothetical protein
LSSGISGAANTDSSSGLSGAANTDSSSGLSGAANVDSLSGSSGAVNFDSLSGISGATNFDSSSGVTSSTLDDHRFIAQRLPQRTRKAPNRLPATVVINMATAAKGGRYTSILPSHNDDELEITLNSQDQLTNVVVALVNAELCEESPETRAEFVSAALSEPIDDPNAKDPKSIREAQLSIYWAHWLAALHEELESLKAKGVYRDVDEVPPGRKAVDSKWVLHIKRDGQGLISRFKARLVAKGFTQIPGQDFTFTFAPVARWESIRILLTIVASYDWELRQIDVKTAFLNGPLDAEIYMKKPEILGRGFWLLLKGLYGLKQSGRTWYLELNNRLQTIGLNRIESDWSVHVRRRASAVSMTTTNVDDMLIGSSSKEESSSILTDLGSLFEITDNKEPKYHLGCTIERWRSRRSIKVHQQGYVQSILRDFGMECCNAVQTPMDPGTRLTPREEDDNVDDKFDYPAFVGKVLYLSLCSRPDISYAVRELSRFISNFGTPHIAAAKHLLRYLQGSQSHGVILGHRDDPFPLFRAMSDSDWGMGNDRKSVSGFIIFLGNSPISWSSKQQAIVALSSCEAEYISVTHCARDVLWLRNLFAEIGYPQESPTTIFCDNQGTVACTHDPHAHSKMKHISIREHFIRECISRRTINVVHIDGKENPADLFTKPLGRVLHAQWVSRLNLRASQGGVLKADDAEV